MRRLALALALAVGLGACSGSPTASPSAALRTLTLTSPAFADGGAIPVRYTCDGADVSPPLAWDGVPDGVRALALIVEDPDAGGFIHWVLTDIPGDLRELPEDQGDAIGAPGVTSFARSGWGGPCPPSGEHHYVFTLYALSAPLIVDGAATANHVRSAVDRVLLASGQLTGVYAQGE